MQEINPIIPGRHGPVYFRHKTLRRFRDKENELVIAKMRSACETVDKLWHELEEIEDEIPDTSRKAQPGDMLVIKKRGGRYPVGKLVFNDDGGIHFNYDVMDPKYDENDFVAMAKLQNSHTRNHLHLETKLVRNEYRVHGIQVMMDCEFRQLFFDMLYLIERNTIGKSDLMSILHVNRHLLSQLLTIAASFGMVICTQNRLVPVKRADGTFKQCSRRCLIVASWGCIAKSIILGYGRRNSADYRVIEASDVDISAVKKRDATIARIQMAVHKSYKKAEDAIQAKKDGIPNYKDIPSTGRLRRQRDVRKTIEERRADVAAGTIGNEDGLHPVGQYQPLCGPLVEDRLPAQISFLFRPDPSK